LRVSEMRSHKKPHKRGTNEVAGESFTKEKGLTLGGGVVCAEKRVL